MSEKIVIYRDEKHRYKTNPDFVLRKISGEAVLIPTGETAFGNSMISVNETFSYLWELFREPVTIDEAIRQAKEAFDDPTGQMEKHILGFVIDGVRYGTLSEEE